MLIITYDISDDKVRTAFSQFIKKFGKPLQYSVYEIKNSQRILDNILAEIEHRFQKCFKNSDSVLIFQTCKACDKKIIKFGFPAGEDDDIIFL